MGLRINTNMASINAQRVLDGQQRRLEHAQAAMASGSRIVTAADDAAGLAISENIRGQVVGIRMARKNAYNAQSSIQISEGGLNEISNIMNRLRELGVQAASDNVSEVERKFLDREAQNMIQEAERISQTTRFGNQVLLNGTSEEMSFHVGPFGDENNVISYSLNADATANALGIDGANLEDKESARDMLGIVDEGIIKISEMRADFGAVQSRLQRTVSNLDIQNENLTAAMSRIKDSDIAYESAEMASAQILQNASIAVLAQANQNGAAALRLVG